MRNIQHLSTELIHIISEPGDKTIYDYYILKEYDNYKFIPAKNTFNYPQVISKYDLNDTDDNICNIADKYNCNYWTVKECSICGMAVNATCAKCDEPLVDDSLEKDDGSKVQISKCPNGHGKIKSPMCCGQDMSCSIG